MASTSLERLEEAHASLADLILDLEAEGERYMPIFDLVETVIEARSGAKERLLAAAKRRKKHG